MSSGAGFGRYHFMPWARRGLGAALDKPDGPGLPARAALAVQLTVQAQDPAATVAVDPVTVSVYGPGDVTGIDPNLVIRTEPRHLTNNFEPNYLAGIEFDAPDFPWLFTPAAPAGQRLRPWVALIVLEGDEFTESTQASIPLPSIVVSKVAALQDLTDSWSWAHVQLTSEDGLAQALRQDPGHAISRLVCPRRLDPETSYTAFLVPAFEVGRQAGLGQDVSALTTADPAWTQATPPNLRLPHYYRFSFHTSDEGDFESLVRRLKPAVLPKTVGQRPIAVDQPGQGIPSAGTPLGLDGALFAIGTTETPWSDPERTAFESAVQDLINHTDPPTDDPAAPNPEDPNVVPPIYGRWHAGVRAVDRTKTGWLDELNLDPRNRSEAGMGTQVVLAERTALLASAWNQIASVIQANQLLRQAQLARAAVQQSYRQHFAPAAPITLLRLTEPLHSRLRASPRTVRATVRESRLPERMLSGTFRRLTRPLGPVRRRQSAPAASHASLYARVNDGSIAVVPPIEPPNGMVSVEQVSDGLVPPFLRGLRLPLLALLALVVLAILLLVAVLAVVAGPLAAIVALAAAVAAVIAAAPAVGAALDRAAVGEAVRFDHVTPATVAAVPPRPGFTLLDSGVAPAGGGGPGPDSPEAAAFRAAAGDLATVLQAPQPAAPAPPALEVEALRTTVLAAVDPVATVPRRTLTRVRYLNPAWQPEDPIADIMAAPSFPQPMYRPLAELSEEYILPGVEFIEPDTLGLLQANNAFIEAYMVGVNHEMARQLLWVGYPTDQRGSYFRQFWDVAGYVPRPGDPTGDALVERLRDIPPVHTWPLGLGLGHHENRPDLVQDNVVLLVRGELLRRYPNTIIFAGPAVLDGSQLELDESPQAEQRYLTPIYSATLAPDLTFFGFNLSVEDARGGTQQSPHGYFFGLQQVPTEPRFGLEPSAKDATCQRWADLAWTNFATGGGGLQAEQVVAPQYVAGYTAARLASTTFDLVLHGPAVIPDFLPATQQPKDVDVSIAHEEIDVNVKWGQDAAQAAYILLRRPFRMLVHAKRMIPNP